MTNRTKRLVIDAKEVEEAFLDCLYREEELNGVEGTPKGTIIVEGVINKLGFHPDRLEEKRVKVAEWLKALSYQFRRNDGGGSSFLNACNQENGVQWTGFHQRMDQLFCLGMGLGLVERQMPRETWNRIPYFVINVE